MQNIPIYFLLPHCIKPIVDENHNVKDARYDEGILNVSKFVVAVCSTKNAKRCLRMPKNHSNGASIDPKIENELATRWSTNVFGTKRTSHR
jgi:hypothetical protein